MNGKVRFKIEFESKEGHKASAQFDSASMEISTSGGLFPRWLSLLDDMVTIAKQEHRDRKRMQIHRDEDEQAQAI